MNPSKRVLDLIHKLFASFFGARVNTRSNRMTFAFPSLKVVWASSLCMMPPRPCLPSFGGNLGLMWAPLEHFFVEQMLYEGASYYCWEQKWLYNLEKIN